ncbi:hypothetical protein MUK42_25587 [Musa troglodytarum]|uniref:Uncharacterized protein n=1 Tax=Musa troglodytarum TaxID=320322 RepID=A0A9E7EXB3_9LILI|nr:hypothetical protein MUK42_25587 [Musa troglodytarum]
MESDRVVVFPTSESRISGGEGGGRYLTLTSVGITCIRGFDLANISISLSLRSLSSLSVSSAQHVSLLTEDSVPSSQSLIYDSK